MIDAENSQQQSGWTIHLTNVFVQLVIVWKLTLGSQIIVDRRMILVGFWMGLAIGKIYDFLSSPQ